MTDLALAVCRGGGVGAIGVRLMPAEQLSAMIHEMREQTAAPFNVNLITFFDNDAQIRVCAEERVPVVSFHWRHPSTEHIKLLRDAGVSIWEQIGTVDAARTALGDGIEVVVAQGWATLRYDRGQPALRASARGRDLARRLRSHRQERGAGAGAGLGIFRDRQVLGRQ